MKKFIITIDTEGDCLWSWKPGSVIKTENTKYLMRFQRLCNDFDFFPVWLTNYEMISDPLYAEFAQNIVQEHKGEIGMHLHAWSTPPNYPLPIAHQEASYLIEYPEKIMEKKIVAITKKITSTIGKKPVSHRAGRWAMNDTYFNLLAKYDYKVDCSITPHVDWSLNKGMSSNSGGANYKNEIENSHFFMTKYGRICEVPMTVRLSHHFFFKSDLSLKRNAGRLYHSLKGNNLWFRPNGKNLDEMMYLLEYVYDSPSDYIMFMLHSSELMPAGSPTFKTYESIENLYRHMRIIFKEASKKYMGITLEGYLNQM